MQAGIGHTLNMYRFLGTALATVIFSTSCATRHADFEERLDQLLAEEPDDPDVLFLHHNSRNLPLCSRLADLRPEPVVLASVVSAYLSGMSDEHLPEFDRLLALWRKRDADNAMPFVVKGLVEVMRGKLQDGVATIVGASRLPVLRTYASETIQEAWRLQRKFGLGDIISMGAVFRFTSVTLAMAQINASRLLEPLSFEKQLRGDLLEALRLAEADCRLWTLFEESSRGDMESALVSEKLPWVAARLCELQLMTDDEKSAERIAEIARRSWREHRYLERARKLVILDDPMARLMKAAGLIKSKPSNSRGESDVWQELIALCESFKSKEFWNRYYDLLRKNEPTIRPYLESQISSGNREYLLGTLTEIDRREIASLKPPIDRFWEARAEFYPRRLSSEQMGRLIDLMTTSGDTEAAEFDQVRAFHALVRWADASTLPKLRALLEDEEGIVNPRVVVILTSVGDRSPRLREAAARAVNSDDGFYPGTCWAAARLGLTEAIPQLVEDLVLETSWRRVSSARDLALPAYLALRDLTKQEFEFEANSWREWAEKNGFWKVDD